MARVKVGGVKVNPAWDWSEEYRNHVRDHAIDLARVPMPPWKMRGDPGGVQYILSGKGLDSKAAEHRAAEAMIRYALWICERDGTIDRRAGISLATNCVIVDVVAGTVRFTLHRDLDGHLVNLPHHGWRPLVVDESGGAEG